MQTTPPLDAPQSGPGFLARVFGGVLGGAGRRAQRRRPPTVQAPEFRSSASALADPYADRGQGLPMARQATGAAPRGARAEGQLPRTRSLPALSVAERPLPPLPPLPAWADEEVAALFAMDAAPRLSRIKSAPDLRLLERMHEQKQAQTPEQILADIDAWVANASHELELELALEEEDAPQVAEIRENVETAADLLRDFELSDWVVSRPRYSAEPASPRSRAEPPPVAPHTQHERLEEDLMLA